MLADVPSIALSTLAAFLRTGITGLTVKEEWPYANENLVYPTLTITMNKPKRMPIMPYQLSVTDPDVDNKVTANEAVAFWEDTFQLDLWTRDKLERKNFTDAVIALFNSQEMDSTGNNNPDGLSLQMTAHFNELCRYEIDTVMPADDEMAAQRQERREKITVLINCREVRQRTYYAMKTVQTHTQVVTDIDLTDDDSGTEVYTVPTE